MLQTMFSTLIISALAVGITAYILPGVSITPWWWAVVIAVVLGFINTFVKPIVKLLALPVTILTIGLFSFVINGLMILLCAWIVPAFQIDGFWPVMLYSVVLGVVSWVLNLIFRK